MEQTATTEQDRRKSYLQKIAVDPKQMGNKWELQIKLENTEGVKAFGGYQLSSYPHPLTGRDTPLTDVNGNEVPGFLISRTSQIFDITDPTQRRQIDWLLTHPRVKILGLKLSDEALVGKQDNTHISLTNLDMQEMTQVDNEDKIDYVIGKISDDNPKTGLSTTKLRYLLAEFGIPYFDLRHVKERTKEKKFLRRRLKDFARGTDAFGNLNALKIEKVLDDIDSLKYTYEFREMIRYDIIRESNGVFKYNNVPLGSNPESAILWMKNNLDIYTEMIQPLYERLKADGFVK